MATSLQKLKRIRELYAASGNLEAEGLALQLESLKGDNANLSNQLGSALSDGTDGTALLLEALEVPRSAFTALFAVGRVAGWCAHIFEQEKGGRIIRPQSNYVGPRES